MIEHRPDGLFIREKNGSNNLNRYNNLLLMNPTISQFFELAWNVLDHLDVKQIDLEVNPSIAVEIWNKLLKKKLHINPFFVLDLESDIMDWSFQGVSRPHDEDGRAVREIKICATIRGKPEVKEIRLSERYGGKDNTVYRIYEAETDYTEKTSDEPILLLSDDGKHRLDVKFFQASALIFLQVYGWKTVPIFPKLDPPGVI